VGAHAYYWTNRKNIAVLAAIYSIKNHKYVSVVKVCVLISEVVLLFGNSMILFISGQSSSIMANTAVLIIF
jgi:hypothetical protein